jgi:hypothetical protein
MLICSIRFCARGSGARTEECFLELQRMRDDKLAMFGGRRSVHNYGLRKKRTMLGSAGVFACTRWHGVAGEAPLAWKLQRRVSGRRSLV